MTGFGNLYSEMNDDSFDYDRNYDAEDVFSRFGKSEETGTRAARPAVSRTAGGVIVETRKRRQVKMPY